MLLYNQIETLRAVKHKNIVQLYGVYENQERKLCLVLGEEYCTVDIALTNIMWYVLIPELAETSLDKHLKYCTPDLATSLDWSIQIAEGIFKHFIVTCACDEMVFYHIYIF